MMNNVFLYPKVKFLCWLYDVDMLATLFIDSFGIGISVKFCLVTTHAYYKHKIVYMPSILLMVPKHVNPLVNANILFMGEFFSCV